VAVGLTGLPELYPVAGVRLGTGCAGIKKVGHRDLVVMDLCEGAITTAVFTRNAFCAAPVSVAREHLAYGNPRMLLVNTGNANAGTGEQGLRDAHACCACLAGMADCGTEEILPFSTGVIGEPLPVAAIEAGLPAAYGALSVSGWADAAHGIMTTDTVPKGASRRIDIEENTVTVTGIAKGAGMIRPDMATMLAFIATDAAIAPDVLHRCLEHAVAASFNRITVDGDTSTNDACVLIASGQASMPRIEQTGGDGYTQLRDAVTEVCLELAQAMVRDGEGATKFITIEVCGGASQEECRQVAYTIAHSPLVKTAFFASDPNWGRILAAVGRSGLSGLDVHKVDIYLDNVCIVQAGRRAPDYTEERGQQAMARDEIVVRVELGRGSQAARVWTCDLSYDYVRINAEYRT